MRKWLRDKYSDKIEPIEVVHETAQFVTYEYKDWQGKKRETRVLEVGVVFDTFEDAKQFSISRAERNLASAKQRVDQCRSNLDAANKLKEPQ